MTGMNKLCVVALFGVVMVAASQAFALNVDNVIIYKGVERTNGVVDTNGYVFRFEVNATGMDNGGVFQNMSTATWYGLASEGPNRWVYEQHFASQAALDASCSSVNPNSVNFLLLLNSRNTNHALPPFTDQVQLGFAVLPPSVFANISNPLNNATGVPLNPAYAWDNMSGGTKSHILGLQVWDEIADAEVYGDLPETNTGKTTWQPGTLGLGEYSFGVMNIRLTGTSVQNGVTLNGDTFKYYGGNGQENTVDFSTTVPEPSTVALVGTALLGLIGWRRRRSLK